MLFEIGALIHHRYRIEALLGQGAMGAAYKVRDENVGGAARVLKVNLNPDPGSEALFRQGAHVAAVVVAVARKRNCWRGLTIPACPPSMTILCWRLRTPARRHSVW